MPRAMSPSTDEPGPWFWLLARALTHVGAYRRFYAVGAVWLAVMLLVPRVGLPPSDQAASPGGMAAPRGGTAPGDAAPAASPGPTIGMAFQPEPFTDQEIGPGPLRGDEAVRPVQGNVDGPEPDPPPEAPEPSSLLPIDIPPPPAMPVPPPPAELAPLLAVVSPVAKAGCSPIGLAAVVVALAGPGVSEVPVHQIVPYLTPLYVACATFPQTGPRTVCELDEVYVSQDPSGGLLPPPAVIGLGVDTLAQLELAMGGFTSMAETIRTQLNCRPG